MTDGKRPLLTQLVETVNKLDVDKKLIEENLAGSMGTNNGKIEKNNRHKVNKAESKDDSAKASSIHASTLDRSDNKNDQNDVKSAVMSSDPCIVDMSVSKIKSCSFRLFSPFLNSASENSNDPLQNNVKCFQRTSAPITPEKMKLISSASGYTEMKESTSSPKRDFHVDTTNSLKYEQPLKKFRQEEHDEEEVIIPAKEYVSLRQWEWTYLGSEFNNGKQKIHGMDFTFLSYNVLSQDLLEDNIWLYPHCEDEILRWNWRKQHLLHQFKTFKPDILCLQEVNKDHFKDFFEPELTALGYTGRYQKRSGYKYDGCATFYKTSKFVEEDVKSVEYCRIGNSLDRDNVALLMKLKPIIHREAKGDSAENESICIANTHLLFNPRRGDVKLAQLIMLFAEIDKMAHKENVATGPTSYSPMIICGDFNSQPQSEIYKFVTRGFLHYDGLLSNYLSGQRGSRRGRDVALSANFFPSNLQISDQCQFIHLGFERGYGSTTAPYHSNGRPFFPSPTTPISDDGVILGENRIPYMSQQTGYLWHHLNLVSAYNHRIERLGYRENEVTTHHYGADCTVDYIFYNVNHRDIVTSRNGIRPSNIVEGKLKVLGRYGLLSSNELASMGSLPNAFDPSDHLPIMVKFLLTS